MAEDAATPRPSRYKSQRHVDHLHEPSSPQQDEGVVRSKSRYHRRPGTAGATSAEIARQAPPQPDLPSRYHSKSRDSPLKPLYQEQVVQRPAQPRQTSQTSSNTLRSSERHASPPAQSGARDPRVAEALGGRSKVERDPARGLALTQTPSPPTPTSAPTGELFPPTKPIVKAVRMDGPPQSGQIRATRSLTELPLYEPPADAGCFGGLFKRKRVEGPPTGVDGTAIPYHKTSDGEPLPIRPGGGGIVPGTDAPVSAVNAGDRIVLVEFGKTKRVFPVTPTTTPLDVIKSASTCMSERIDVKSAVLLEYFSTVGVRRPLRRYEYVRSVMNSWDSDRQNSLLLVDPMSGTVEQELTLAGVPKHKPEEQSWYLFHSQKIGKWEKQFVTLRSDGQIVCRKDADKVKDVMNVCHLSDFDIYEPTTERMKKKIKPPKKMCFAIKSQQKTSMFETTDNFVHFFATGDKPTAESFYQAVQGWRSWYLVNVLGEGMKEKTTAPVLSRNGRAVGSGNDDAAKRHRVQDSVGSHYQLGSFKPLIDMESFEKPRPQTSRSHDEPQPAPGAFTKSANQFDVNVSPERRTSTVKRKHPPIAQSNRAQLKDDEPLANLTRAGSVKKGPVVAERRVDSGGEFKNTGLLGRQYSQRRKEYEEKEAQQEQPWTTGPNLLNGRIDGREAVPSAGNGIQRQTSTRRQGEVRRSGSTRDRNLGSKHGNAGGLHRAESQSRHKPKPLVDLTPEYREAPQFAKKLTGKGFVPEGTNGTGLIDSATSPEDVLGIPSSTNWRHRGPQNNTRIGSGSAGSHSPAVEAFTGEGLLGARQEKPSRGGSKHHTDGKPLVDLMDDDTFVNGSLLKKVQKAEGIPAPIIDRVKRP